MIYMLCKRLQRHHLTQQVIHLSNAYFHIIVDFLEPFEDADQTLPGLDNFRWLGVLTVA